MEYLKKIEINNNAYDQLGKLKGKSIEFIPGLNIIVGENGIGKSGLISKIGDSSYIKAFSTVELSIIFFDSEKMNPRIQKRTDTAFSVHALFMSHGECQHKMIDGMSDNFKEKNKHFLILVDEPESGLSPWKQKEILDYYIKISKNVQIIITSHSLILTGSNEGRLIELTEEKITYFDPPSSYDWRG
jgi:predicted ATPase